jgi:spermidine synthase
MGSWPHRRATLAVRQWTVAFCGTFLLLLPATAAMGATLPAMERVLARMRRQGTSIAALYAGNTFGAVLGVLGTAFWLDPEFGLVRHRGRVCGTELPVRRCSIPAFCRARTSEPAPAKPTAPGVLMRAGYYGPAGHRLRGAGRAGAQSGRGEHRLYLRDLAGRVPRGHCAWRRRLSALGALLGDPERLRDRLLRALAAACLLGALMPAERRDRQGVRCCISLGETAWAPRCGRSRARNAAAFLLPTIVMGALFSHLGTSARAAGIGFGRALGQHLGCRAGAAVVRRAAGAGARSEVGAAARSPPATWRCRRDARGRANPVGGCGSEPWRWPCGCRR